MSLLPIISLEYKFYLILLKFELVFFPSYALAWRRRRRHRIRAVLSRECLPTCTGQERKLAFAEPLGVCVIDLLLARRVDELDALQTTIHHWLEIDGRPAAVLRVLAHEEAIAIGRVATAHEHRGKGLAGRLMRLVLQDLAPLGQSHLEQWYERFGFVRSGNEVLEVGIPHVPMTLSR